MSRLPRLPVDEWDHELKELAGGSEISDFEQATLGVMAHNPEILKALLTFHAARAKHSRLSPRLRELVRLRVAFHNQCRSCMAVRYQSALEDGLTEELVCSLEKPEEAPDLSPSEKAALAYADRATLDHLSINDEAFARLLEHFSNAQIVELGILVASCIGFGRFAASLHMVESLPDAYKHGSGSIAPWTHGAEVV